MQLCEKLSNWTTPTWFLLPATASVVPFEVQCHFSQLRFSDTSKASGHWSQHPTHPGIPFQIPRSHFLWQKKISLPNTIIMLKVGKWRKKTCKGNDRLGGNDDCGRKHMFQNFSLARRLPITPLLQRSQGKFQALTRKRMRRDRGVNTLG